MVFKKYSIHQAFLRKISFRWWSSPATPIPSIGFIMSEDPSPWIKRSHDHFTDHHPSQQTLDIYESLISSPDWCLLSQNNDEMYILQPSNSRWPRRGRCSGQDSETINCSKWTKTAAVKPLIRFLNHFTTGLLVHLLDIVCLMSFPFQRLFSF